MAGVSRRSMMAAVGWVCRDSSCGVVEGELKPSSRSEEITTSRSIGSLVDTKAQPGGCVGLPEADDILGGGLEGAKKRGLLYLLKGVFP